MKKMALSSFFRQNKSARFHSNYYLGIRMQLRPLGTTGIDVSILCLGTMTWGEQNSQGQAHQQLDYALERGINFIDTAEMYPVPPKAQTYSATETIIGQWQKLHSQRSRIILATKAIGPAAWASYIRDGKPRLNRSHLTDACHASLKRLKTDYIDLYQLHWPDRNANIFGQRGFTFSPHEDFTPIEETLRACQDLQQAGKVRFFGLSNETPWGVMRFLQLAQQHSLPRMQSIQNPYNLLNRTYEIGLAEISMREQCGLLAYSPLAMGVLSGKYLNNQRPEGSRLTRWARFDRYTNMGATNAAERYVTLAKQWGISPAQMALAFINSRPFITSNIIGATTMEQLRENIDSTLVELPRELLQTLEAIHKELPDPCA
jgi:aryl-alcohol dehydrogenase-like predicted oxidoreductase